MSRTGYSCLTLHYCSANTHSNVCTLRHNGILPLIAYHAICASRCMTSKMFLRRFFCKKKRRFLTFKSRPSISMSASAKLTRAIAIDIRVGTIIFDHAFDHFSRCLVKYNDMTASRVWNWRDWVKNTIILLNLNVKQVNRQFHYNFNSRSFNFC